MDQKRIYLSASIAGIIVLLLYIWFASLGPWRVRGYTSDYYWRMASAFQHGQIALEEKPHPDLLALPDLYDPKARKNIPLLGDASVYEGNYYLYFGALPSIFLALISWIVPMKPGDQVFVYLFLSGLFVVQSLFFVSIFRRYFPRLPVWIVPAGILLLGLTGPFTRMLAHPYIHEAAIAGGQFFATAGLYLAFLALHKKPIRHTTLVWAGTLWACAIATRITQLIPVAAMFAVACLFLIYEYRRAKRDWGFVRSLIMLATPLAVAGILLAWYNWTRFDSIFEFGLYYQLAAFHLQANYDALFSRVYVIQNIYNYFFTPFEMRSTFPFAYPLPGTEESVVAWREMPRLYAVEGKFAGLLYSTPFLIFSVAPLVVMALTILRASRGNKTEEVSVLWHWITVSLLVSFIAGSIPTLLIFYVGFRYETEFITGLLMLAVLGFCQAYARMRNPSTQRALAIVGACLAMFTLLMNVALAYTGIIEF